MTPELGVAEPVQILGQDIRDYIITAAVKADKSRTRKDPEKGLSNRCPAYDRLAPTADPGIGGQYDQHQAGQRTYGCGSYR